MDNLPEHTFHIGFTHRPHTKRKTQTLSLTLVIKDTSFTKLCEIEIPTNVFLGKDFKEIKVNKIYTGR